MSLRPYQLAAFQAILDSFRGGHRAPLCVLPTGTGKSHVIKALVEYALSFPGQRVLILSHTKEIIEQDHRKISPGFDAGIYSAGLQRRDTGNAAIFASIQSVYKRALRLGAFNLVIIDECHLMRGNDSSMYGQLIDGLRELSPGLCLCGFTATPYRLDSGRLIDGPLFDAVAYDGSRFILRYIAEGYLSPLVTAHTATELDTDAVKLSGGDYQLKALQAAVNVDELTAGAVREIIQQGQERAHWLVFAAGIEHAESVCAVLQLHGVSAGVVHSKREGRDQAIEAFKRGEIRALVNNNVLTVGFDFPGVDLIAVLRPTQSPVLWVQMCGRGMRPAPGKLDCLVLDFARNIERLGPINDVAIPKGKRKGRVAREAPVKYCPVCGRYTHASARECSCGHQWPRELKIATEASSGAILDDGAPKVERFRVDAMELAEHAKPGKVPTLRVDYRCGLRRFSRWLCPEHTGYPRRVFERWWVERGEGDPPDTVQECLTKKVAIPGEILVNLRGKYPEILNDSPVRKN